MSTCNLVEPEHDSAGVTISGLAQYYRRLADSASDKYGDALTCFNQAETLVKEVSCSASSFSSAFVSNMSPNLPADTGASIQEQTKVHHTICREKRNEVLRENDFIHHAIVLLRHYQSSRRPWWQLQSIYMMFMESPMYDWPRFLFAACTTQCTWKR